MEEEKSFVFTDVRQEMKEYTFTGAIKIYFTLEEVSFYLTIRTLRKMRKHHEFGLIFHVQNLHACPFCEENDLLAGSYCRVLSNAHMRKKVFEALIQEPPIRLEWIYLDYPK